MPFDGSSLKRSREAPNRDELPSWECDPFYGIVHPSGCSICRSYMSHMSEARASHCSSIERASKDLDHQLDTYFFDGVAEGRRRQRADDQDRVRDLEKSRSDFVAINSRLRSESHETAQQLSSVKSQLRLAQSECDALRKRLESFTNEKLDDSPNVQAAHEDLEVERMLVDDETHDVEENSPSHFPATPTSDVSPPHSAKPEDSSGSTPPLQISKQFPNVSTASLPETETSSRSVSTVRLPARLPARPTVEVIASSGALDFRPAISFSSIHSVSTPKTLRQLQYLMNRAHQPGNDECLAKVKMLCAEAHRTPREEKTELHRYMLANWRNPPGAGTAAPPPSPPPAPLLLPDHALQAPRANNPRMDDPVEVWHTYLTTHRGSWPRGVRRAADGSPHMGDLKASRTVARLRPDIGENGDTTLRTEFMACAAQLFASPGMYQDLLRRNSLSVAPVISYRPYRASQFSISAAEVARHFAAAGVSADDAVTELEPWAQEYQAAVVFPTGSEPRRPKPYNYSPAKSTSVYRPRQYEPQDRFGWR
ncbi:hypothetical protein B0H14DRAFT_2975474 [Mycena olivaceomarginata]|nr:hypothetical protein B0H14DRAFT_2975474 [Mycena olivaceomarginata]